jgi:hypothetical protein
MIDTVAISLREGYKIKDYGRFTPHAKSLFEPPYRAWNGQNAVHSVQNPSKEDVGYKPKLTLSRVKGQGSYPILRVEFSAPKFLYGNNLQELEDSDFDAVIVQLQAVLKEMAVETSTGALDNAAMSAIHYSKNIILEDGLTCRQVLGEIAKSNLTDKLDCDWRSFKNGGEAVKFHCNEYELAFYDKVKDMEHANLSVKRSIGGDGGVIAEGSEFYNKEILRVEARLNKPRILRDILSRSGCEVETKFQDLFSAGISKAVLNYFWEIIKSNMPLRVPEQDNAADIFYATAGQKNIYRLQQTAFVLLAKELGIRAVKDLIATKKDRRQFTDLLKDTAALKAKFKFSPFASITEALRRFIPLK